MLEAEAQDTKLLLVLGARVLRTPSRFELGQGVGRRLLLLGRVERLERGARALRSAHETKRIAARMRCTMQV